MLKVVTTVVGLVNFCNAAKFVFNPPDDMTNFDETSNWLGPFSLDNFCTGRATLEFDRKIRVGSYMGGRANYSNLIFPDTSIYLFDNSGTRNITLGASAQRSNLACFSERNVLSYKLADTVSWHSIYNWDIKTNYDYHVINFKSYVSNNLLHCQKVPGLDDEVLFVTNRTYRTKINVPFNIKKLTISQMQHSTQSFYWDYIETVEGQIQFNMGEDMVFDIESPLLINDLGCEDANGCINPNLNTEIIDEICGSCKCDSSLILPCSNPIKPKGHCCFMCGSMVTILSDMLLFQSSVYQISQYFLEDETNRNINQTALDYDFSFIRIEDHVQNHVKQYQLVVAFTNQIYNQYVIREKIDKAFQLIQYENDGYRLGTGGLVPAVWLHSYPKQNTPQIVSISIVFVVLFLMSFVVAIVIYFKRNPEALESLRLRRNALLVSGLYKRADSDLEDEEDTVHLSATECSQGTATNATVKMSDLADSTEFSEQNSHQIDIDDTLPLVKPFNRNNKKSSNLKKEDVMSYVNPTYGIEE